jgi:hypothetical protein
MGGHVRQRMILLWTLGQQLHVLRRFPPPARTVEVR